MMTFSNYRPVLTDTVKNQPNTLGIGIVLHSGGNFVLPVGPNAAALRAKFGTRATV